MVNQLPTGVVAQTHRRVVLGTLSYLKRCVGWARCAWRSLRSYTAYAWASVVTANLLLIARRQLDGRTDGLRFSHRGGAARNRARFLCPFSSFSTARRPPGDSSDRTGCGAASRRKLVGADAKLLF
jgi:hypothetical protein